MEFPERCHMNVLQIINIYDSLKDIISIVIKYTTKVEIVQTKFDTRLPEKEVLY